MVDNNIAFGLIEKGLATNDLKKETIEDRKETKEIRFFKKKSKLRIK